MNSKKITHSFKKLNLSEFIAYEGTTYTRGLTAVPSFQISKTLFINKICDLKWTCVDAAWLSETARYKSKHINEIII